MLRPHLNYHHLAYFQAVARSGGVAQASRRLGVGSPTISAQVRSLERSLGVRLFQKAGRRLELTEEGRLALVYADEIFATGNELLDALRGRPAGRGLPFRVGIADVMAKSVAYRLLEPALELPEVRLECREAAPEALFAALARHELDLVLSDVPLRPGSEVRAFNHVLGETGTSLIAAPALAERLGPDFPRSLDDAPLLLPWRESAVRRPLEQWLEAHGLRPRVVAEFQDSSMLRVFGAAGHGVFPAPTVVEEELCERYGLRALARLEDVRDRFYAVSPERRLGHPAAQRITRAAREGLFETQAGTGGMEGRERTT
jgi:LysR family transcriptional activator of nhaA